MSFIGQFNYNRDSLTQGDIVGFTGAPIYGSSITFTATNSSWRGSDYYQFVMANGINSIKAEMDFTFQGNKDDIKSILRRIENATTGTITGDIAFSGTEDCINFGESKNKVQLNLDTAYYQNFSGSQISDYNLKHISSDVYELNVSLFNNRVSPILSNGEGFIQKSSLKYPVLHFGGYSFYNDSSYSHEKFNVYQVTGANSIELENFFYASSGVNSSAFGAGNIFNSYSGVTGLKTYTGITDEFYNDFGNDYDGGSLTRTFFWEPDQQVSLPISHSTRVNQFKNSFHQQLNISRNQNRIDQLNLKFTNRSEKETYSILHFLESHLGYKQFVYYYDDDIIKQNRVFYCPRWRHTFNYKNSNTIEATFVEIVAPVTPEF